MEVVVYGALTTIWWMSSMSVLLPLLLLLKFNKFFRDRWFSFFFERVLGPIYAPKMVPLRKKAFGFLEKHLKDRDNSKQLDILEIGIGGGSNLQFYPENSSLTALDMNESFEKYFAENRKKHPQIKYARSVVAVAENMTEVEDSSMDLVICTYVLCSVMEIGQALSEVKRVLKPGGKFLFLEHVAYPRTQWGNTIQRFVAPLWKIYFDGCMPHQNIGEKIREAGFSNVELENFCPSGFMLFVRPQIVGIATK
ncbi:hypothetical protein JTE90_023128 [Oedothorax gibbosus]|uniref:Methyltransferase type 11 domain-containing protein n=1 Tax=Oedothorax gibbosus TaxID=931172 RepID=A0AAV6UNV3_9ARAC|nr:hypothetical protein JTE90_023128 [Oedothorax gibbosus]